MLLYISNESTDGNAATVTDGISITGLNLYGDHFIAYNRNSGSTTNANWDTDLHGNALHAWKLNHYDYNTDVSVGHSVAKNIWLNLGYNFSGFSASRHTNRGMFFKFRLKFDQTSVRDAVKWASQ